jgi:hypothetical protein
MSNRARDRKIILVASTVVVSAVAIGAYIALMSTPHQRPDETVPIETKSTGDAGPLIAEAGKDDSPAAFLAAAHGKLAAHDFADAERLYNLARDSAAKTQRNSVWYGLASERSIRIKELRKNRHGWEEPTVRGSVEWLKKIRSGDERFTTLIAQDRLASESVALGEKFCKDSPALAELRTLRQQIAADSVAKR